MNLLAPSAQRMPFTTEATEEHRGLRRTEYLLPQRAQRSTETWIGLRCRAGRLAARVRTTARGNWPLISRIWISVIAFSRAEIVIAPSSFRRGIRSVSWA